MKLSLKCACGAMLELEYEELWQIVRAQASEKAFHEAHTGHTKPTVEPATSLVPGAPCFHGTLHGTGEAGPNGIGEYWRCTACPAEFRIVAIWRGCEATNDGAHEAGPRGFCKWCGAERPVQAPERGA